MNLIFTKAKEDEINEIMLLFKATTKHLLSKGIEQWGEDYPALGDIKEDISKGELYVGRSGEKILAAFTINDCCDEEYASGKWKDTQADFSVLHRICVDPTLQGQGLGKKTMQEFERLALLKGNSSIRLDAFEKNPVSNSFYQGLGYYEVGEFTWRKGTLTLYEKIF